MLMFLAVNIMFIDVKVNFAIPILLLISLSLLASDVNSILHGINVIIKSLIKKYSHSNKHCVTLYR